MALPQRALWVEAQEPDKTKLTTGQKENSNWSLLLGRDDHLGGEGDSGETRVGGVLGSQVLKMATISKLREIKWARGESKQISNFDHPCHGTQRGAEGGFGG